MRGGSHTSYQSDLAKREQWLAEMSARPEVQAQDLLGLFSDPEFIERIDHEQRRLQEESVSSLIGFSALTGASKDESRLFQIARTNLAMYEDSIEDAIYEDSLLRQLLAPAIRDMHRGDELYSEAVRLRRTVVAYFLVYTHYLQEQDSTVSTNLQAG